jgi:citrate lyase subunit beta / citryl-CoA lyase
MTDAGALREQPPRSLLFVPADRAMDLLPKALRSGADAIILDLEDGVAPHRRAAARAGLVAATNAAAAAAGTDIPLFVRVAAAGTAGFEADVTAARGVAGAGVVLAKVEGAGDVILLLKAWTAQGMAQPSVIALIETAHGLLAAAEIAAADAAVIGLALGAEDLAAQVGFLRTPAGDEILLARSLVVLSAAAAGRWAADTPNLDLRGSDAIENDARHAAALGFAGKLLVHPAQVGPVHAAFRPSESDIERAVRIIAAADAMAAEGRGVGSVDGRMVDAPIVAAARRVVARNTRYDGGGAKP